jgi:hypothetical protein
MLEINIANLIMFIVTMIKFIMGKQKMAHLMVKLIMLY